MNKIVFIVVCALVLIGMILADVFVSIYLNKPDKTDEQNNDEENKDEKN